MYTILYIDTHMLTQIHAGILIFPRQVDELLSTVGTSSKSSNILTNASLCCVPSTIIHTSDIAEIVFTSTKANQSKTNQDT